MRLSDLFHIFGDQYLSLFKDKMPPSHLKAISSIRKCRTSEMGGQLYACPECKANHYAYHSCNNRHCPKCGGDKTQLWIKNQFELLLPVPYFFVTFTIPKTLRPLFRSHQRLCYSLFFDASSQALKDLALNKHFVGGYIGFFGILQTWAANLIYHPHIHYIVPGVALSPDHKRWIKIKNKKFLVHVKPLSLRFKSLFKQALKKTNLYSQIPASLWNHDWVVHCEQAGYGREIIQYVAPYVYRTALSDHHPLKLDNQIVSFHYKDNQSKERETCRLDAMEFIRRFLQHVLPAHFVKVRYYGLLGANQRHQLYHLKLLLLQSLSDKEQAGFLSVHFDDRKKHPFCIYCGSRLVLIGSMLPIRGP